MLKVFLIPDHPFVPQIRVPCKQRRAEGSAGVARGRLNPDIFERPFPEDPAVAHAIQGDTPRKNKVFLARFLLDVSRLTEHDFFGDRLATPDIPRKPTTI